MIGRINKWECEREGQRLVSTVLEVASNGWGKQWKTLGRITGVLGKRETEKPFVNTVSTTVSLLRRMHNVPERWINCGIILTGENRRTRGRARSHGHFTHHKPGPPRWDTGDSGSVYTEKSCNTLACKRLLSAVSCVCVVSEWCKHASWFTASCS